MKALLCCTVVLSRLLCHSLKSMQPAHPSAASLLAAACTRRMARSCYRATPCRPLCACVARWVAVACCCCC